VATVEAYAAHERATLEAVVQARRNAADARGGAATQATQDVRDYNTRVEAFPSRVIAALGHFEKREYFEIEPATRDAGAPEIALG